MSTPELPDPDFQHPYRPPMPVEEQLSPERLAELERRRKEERAIIGLALVWTTWQAIWDLLHR